jgi:hypothetical protein
MRILALLVIVAIAIALWRARGQRYRETFRVAGIGRTVELPTPGRLAETETEKPVGGEAGFLHDLKRREREARRRETQRASPASGGPQTIIDAEFREVSSRDSRT